MSDQDLIENIAKVGFFVVICIVVVAQFGWLA